MQKPTDLGNLQNFKRFLMTSSEGFCCFVALAFFVVGFANNGVSADTPDPLLDLFIQKGFVTQEEAAKVKAEADSLRTNEVSSRSSMDMESKWKISRAIKDVELFGDIRTRFEDRKVTDPEGGEINLQRLRYALRFGLRGEAFDDFFYGFRIETASNPRSPWVTFGTSSSGAPYQGPFGKSTSGLDVGQIYLGWKPADWGSVTVGRISNPLYVTPMTWDTDINPEGFAEKFKVSVGEAEFFANFGQFLYQDTNPEKSSSGYFNFPQASADLPFLLAWQAGLNYHVTKNLDLKVAPVIYNYVRNGVNQSLTSQTPGFSGIFVGQGSTNNLLGASTGAWSGYPNGYYDGFTANQTGINNLEVLEVPWELNYTISKVHLRLFGDYAVNLDGGNRAIAAYNASRTAFQPVGGGDIAIISSAQTGDTKAYQIGFGIGSTNLIYGPAQGLVYGSMSRKHAWEFRTYWQHIEQYALDPNLIDSDFFEGRLNMEGVYTALAYGFSENFIGTVRYGYAARINDKLGTGGSNQDIPQMNPINHYYLLQLDLAFRF